MGRLAPPVLGFKQNRWQTPLNPFHVVKLNRVLFPDCFLEPVPMAVVSLNCGWGQSDSRESVHVRHNLLAHMLPSGIGHAGMPQHHKPKTPVLSVVLKG